MTPFAKEQKGQAVVEALLMLPIMALLLWAVVDIGSLQFVAQQATQASRKAVMSAALGQPLQALQAPAGLELRGDAAALSSVAMPRLSDMRDEWFGVGLRMLSVQTRARTELRHDPVVLPIARSISVASGSGHAHGDADAQRRLGAASTAWRQAGQRSLSEAARMASPVDRVDRPWGRPKLSLDWLSPWADVVPADRLSNRREQSR